MALRENKRSSYAAAYRLQRLGRRRTFCARIASVGLRAGACVLLAFALTCAVCACRFSNELIEVNYTQDADFIDYEAVQKNYVPVEDADALRDSSITIYTEQDIDGAEVLEEYVPLFDTAANTDTAIERVYYDEASPLARTAPQFALPEEDRIQEEETEEQDDPLPDTSSVVEGGLQSNQTAGTQTDDAQGAPNDADEGGVGDEGQNDGEGEGEGAAEEEGPQADTESTYRPSERGPQAFNSSGSLLEPLEGIGSVATIGEYADMVLMVGGPGVLCAADDAFLQDGAIARIFSGDVWNMASVRSAWVYDVQTDTYTVNFDELLASQPDLVLLPEGMTLLSQEQIDTLTQLGTSVEPVPIMDSVGDISSAVWWLGETLAVTEAGFDAAARAAEYRTRYLQDDINALITENGGLTSFNGIDYSSSGQPVGTNSNWTVFVTDWDFGATYYASYGGSVLWGAQGLALSRSGYGWSPVNYYFSVGGVNNNAAQFPDATSALTSSNVYPVWQFNLGTLRPDVANFSGLGTSFTALKSSGDAACLVRAPASFSDVSDESDVVTVLGDASFRYVLCATQEIAAAFAYARDVDTATQSGLYAAYQWRTGGLVSGVGYVTPTDRLIEAWIGNLPSWSVSNQSSISVLYDEPYGVQTVANGLYCDWINGSVESFLMAFWIDDFYDSGGTDFSSFIAEASSFYQYFYGYTLTSEDIDLLLAGRVS